MGIDARLLSLLATHCRGTGNSSVLFAGYPDMLVRPRDLRHHFGHTDFTLDPRQWLANAQGREGMTPVLAEPVLRALGYEHFDFVDIQQEPGLHRPPTLRSDLNYPWVAFPGQYEFDLVVDHGTIEHCFNVAQAVLNLASVVRNGGQILLNLPLNVHNHGYYNFSPIFFLDFFGHSNGFEIELFSGCGADGETLWFHPLDEFHCAVEEAYITCLARRTEIRPITFPAQLRYIQAAKDHAQQST
jgi:SAM-dependent methyltransferase